MKHSLPQPIRRFAPPVVMTKLSAPTGADPAGRTWIAAATALQICPTPAVLLVLRWSRRHTGWPL